MTSPLQILFVRNNPTSFLNMDLALLSARYQVRDWYQRGPLFDPTALLRAVRKCDLVFGWFASWHTLWPILAARLLGRPSVLVVGGYDTASVPSIAYGNMSKPFKRWISRTTMRLADTLVVNSHFIEEEVVRLAGMPRAKVTMVYHGLDLSPKDRRPEHTEPSRGRVVLTVGKVDRFNLRRKGLEPFVRAAALLPSFTFVVAGPWMDGTIGRLRAISSPNVTFTGRISEEELDELYRRAAVYVQPSVHEGFGLSVAEAMLRECVPVTTRAGALPEVVGDCGVALDSTDPEAVARGIVQAYACRTTLGPRARDRIIEHFPLERRDKEFATLIEGAIRRRKATADETDRA
ncbi:MAG TPA: glycosyltransferase family 4 protein [Bacteroidota bacterium]